MQDAFFQQQVHRSNKFTSLLKKMVLFSNTKGLNDSKICSHAACPLLITKTSHTRDTGDPCLGIYYPSKWAVASTDELDHLYSAPGYPSGS